MCSVRVHGQLQSSDSYPGVAYDPIVHGSAVRQSGGVVAINHNGMVNTAVVANAFVVVCDHTCASSHVTVSLIQVNGQPELRQEAGGRGFLGAADGGGRGEPET